MFWQKRYGWHRNLGPVLKNAIDTEERKKDLDGIRKKYAMQDKDFAALFLRTDFLCSMQIVLHYGDVLAHDVARNKVEAARAAADLRGFAIYEDKFNQAPERDKLILLDFLKKKSDILTSIYSIEDVINIFCEFSKLLNSRFRVNQVPLAIVVGEVDSVLRSTVDDLLNYIEAAYGTKF